MNDCGEKRVLLHRTKRNVRENPLIRKEFPDDDPRWGPEDMQNKGISRGNY